MSAASQTNEQRPLQAEGDLIAAAEVPPDDQDDRDSVFSETFVRPEIHILFNLLTHCRSQSSTASLASSILEYRRIHGRTYHSDGFTTNYIRPNDEQHLESEDLCHHYVTVLLDGRLFLAPLEKETIHRVLDVVTGSVNLPTGFQMLQLLVQISHRANHSGFHRMSISKTGKLSFRKPTDAAHQEDGYSLTKCMLIFAVTTDLLNWLEPILASFGDLFREAGKIMNRHFFVQDMQQAAFDEAGFVEKRAVQYKLPIGPWAKDIKLAEAGRFDLAALENDLQVDEYQEWLANLRKEMRNPKVHSYVIVHVVYGRKPWRSGL
ncbi:uncharacterized protein CPUR_06910 [Claviceps purpurea 20.1]|uniref:Uncharacterized protein n=1 Tax=Claviceps purpurea (strain 20.1) TaxID=1111077 RepID=M1VXG6_CLAP2|nr:uncharacterized protein CPUR_06910 [Claviceps purpurea 20.1]